MNKNLFSLLPRLSRQFSLRLLTPDDVSALYSVCLGNPLYYQYLESPLSYDSVLADLTALPPGKGYEDKLFLGFYEKDGCSCMAAMSEGMPQTRPESGAAAPLSAASPLLAVMDLVLSYPDSETAYIGLFMTGKPFQGRGLGSRIIDMLAKDLTQNGVCRLMLAWAEKNPQSESFWRKNHFLPTGRKSRWGTCPIVEAERKIGVKGVEKAQK